MNNNEVNLDLNREDYVKLKKAQITKYKLNNAVKDWFILCYCLKYLGIQYS